MVSPTTASLLGIAPFGDSPRRSLRSNSTEDEVQAVITTAYRQVFGNAHVMDCERLTNAESLLRQGHITVRDFIRALALSELYQEKFLNSTPQVRFIELNYKHFLGRAPDDESEIAYHVDLFNQEGYEAEINSYIDSQEYQENFGNSIVPSYRGFESQQGQKVVGFSRMFQLYRGYANSDHAQGNGNPSHLTYELARNTATPIRTQTKGQVVIGTNSGSQRQLYRLRVSQGVTRGGPQIRRTISEYLVPYDQLSYTLRQLGKQGDRITSITPA
ncbi:photosystem I reaction center subunit XII [Moorena producens PAL-8-15-08-1]|uniref:Photosystem I reaction center subunit XII n=1 Tax=Moorena producens PAL-8-15-08-1 TaxID=1458985 RepID=A0A1D8TRZ8_9CYAN|nr:phycobilisome linker polypeptide [Moorena producens]AOX00420.1 photosystem I reaction center subunit XII [Moorena producens PAL-8-15-08-1]